MTGHPAWCAPTLCMDGRGGPHLSLARPAADIREAPRVAGEVAVSARLVQRGHERPVVRLRVLAEASVIYDFEIDVPYAALVAGLLAGLVAEVDR